MYVYSLGQWLLFILSRRATVCNRSFNENKGEIQNGGRLHSDPATAGQAKVSERPGTLRQSRRGSQPPDRQNNVLRKRLFAQDFVSG